MSPGSREYFRGLPSSPLKCSIHCDLEDTITSGGSAYNTESLVGSTTTTEINHIELNSSVFVRMKRLGFYSHVIFIIHVLYVF